jgi:hypothetical protein
MKLRRKISRFVQTSLSLWKSSRDNTPHRFSVHLYRFNFIRIRCLHRAETFPWFAHFSGSIVSVLSLVPSTLLWEEYK